MPALEERDYFTDYEILKDPYGFFEAVRAHGPIYRPQGRDYLIVTGFEETLEVLANARDFSAINALQGAAAPLPFTPRGSDITAQVEAHRSDFPGGEMLVGLDDAAHAALRGLVNRLFTPSRLKANEQFISAYSDHLVRTAVARGSSELIREISTPFVTLVIADLLGVPADDRQRFMDVIDGAPPPGSLDSNDNDYSGESHPLIVMGSYFAAYVEDRRRNPRGDILTELACATYADGSTPSLADIVNLATFLFGAGQDTSAKLLGNAMRYIAEQPDLQDRLRADPSLIPHLIEEVLRLEGSSKQTARLARRDTRIGDWMVPAGTPILLALAAANRDPRRWDDPGALQLARPGIREHVAFGRGKHVCAGAPLARVEVRIILEKFLAHTQSIELDEAFHGPRGDRVLHYEPSFIIRGLADLHLKLVPSADVQASPMGSRDEQFPIAGEASHDAPKSGGGRSVPSTAVTKIGVLLAHDDARAMLDRHFPGIATDQRIAMARGLTLRSIQSFAPAQFPDTALDALDVELATLMLE
ncbi:cytochrome P450 [Sphingobium sp. AP49]|uniref:cytochrome P450 n=1 Tax=Sphingobium sp. AP49 TaxID=1144307 RepID=UPI00026EE180|nr:cytochrome P450 [Sphingobium sp. AP49]WHO38470.1 cytochrome P450 [Sphingobium sp. AP49]